MRSNCAVYVDAGYLLSASATLVTGTSLRSGINVNYKSLLDALLNEGARCSDLRVLRVHWYDAAYRGVPGHEHEQIGMLPRVKLRLGRVGFEGQQKGVDLRIGLDMVTHARNGAVDTIVLVSGDDDLTVAVEEAQLHGVEVILLAVPDQNERPQAVSRHLQLAADQLEIVDRGVIEGAVTRKARPLTPEPPVSKPVEVPANTSQPPVPTPASIVARDLTTARPTSSAPRSLLAYSSSTAGPASGDLRYLADEEYAEQIERVARKVVQSFLTSAATADRDALQQGRPSIPQDLDRALLQDMSQTVDLYYLDDEIRTELRRAFWHAVDNFKSAR